MPRRKKEEVAAESAEMTVEAAPTKKPGRKPRAKKETVVAEASAEKPKRTRAPRKKIVVLISLSRIPQMTGLPMSLLSRRYRPRSRPMMSLR